MKLPKPGRLPTTAVLTISLSAAFTVGPAHAANLIWDGSGENDSWFYASNNLFNPNTNWTDNGRYPAPGDSLVFAGNTRLTPLNDGQPGFLVGGISFAPGARAFQLNGNAIASTGNMMNFSANLQTVNMPIKVGATQIWDGGKAGMVVNGPLVLGNSGLSVRNKTAINNGTKLVVGDGGKSDLSLQSGSTLSNLTSTVGNQTSGQGSVTVSNAGSSWTNTGELSVGYNGNGFLNVEDGGKVANTIGQLGGGSSGTGVATVKGANSLWANSNGLLVGAAGKGTLNIVQGGKVSSTYGSLGEFQGGVGKATISGANSLWENSGNLYVGYLGDGTVNIEQGGKVSNRDGLVGYNDSGKKTTGTVTVSGKDSLWANSNSVDIGSTGNGFLNIQGGGKVTGSSGYVGQVMGTGIATITGAESLWANSGDLVVGNFSGNGTVKIMNGGKVTDINAAMGSGSGSSGTVTVNGANSLWSNSGDLTVGGPGKATLTIENDGEVAVGNALSIGSRGIVNLNGGTLSVKTPDINPTAGGQFNWTAGTLHITGSNGVSLGNNPMFGAVTTLNAGKTLAVSNTLKVDAGNFLILNGGQVKAGVLDLSGGTIAANPTTRLNMGGIGKLNGHGGVAAAVAGGNSANVIHANGGNLTLGDLNSKTGFEFGGKLDVGPNQVTLLDQDKATLGLATSIADGGKLATVNGADLSVGKTLGYTGNASVLGDFTHNGKIVGNGGTLTFLNNVSGAGDFSGSVAFEGQYKPGNSPAAIDFHGGDIRFDSTAVLTMELFGDRPGTEYDQLLNINELTFNGTLDLVFASSFVPKAGTVFDLFGFNRFTGNFAPDRLTVTGLDRNLLDLSHLAIDGKLQIQAVPLPAAAWLFLSGLMASSLVGGRRKTSTAVRRRA